MQRTHTHTRCDLKRKIKKGTYLEKEVLWFEVSMNYVVLRVAVIDRALNLGKRRQHFFLLSLSLLFILNRNEECWNFLSLGFFILIKKIERKEKDGWRERGRRGRKGWGGKSRGEEGMKRKHYMTCLRAKMRCCVVRVVRLLFLSLSPCVWWRKRHARSSGPTHTRS